MQVNRSMDWLSRALAKLRPSNNSNNRACLTQVRILDMGEKLELESNCEDSEKVYLIDVSVRL